MTQKESLKKELVSQQDWQVDCGHQAEIFSVRRRTF